MASLDPILKPIYKEQLQTYQAGGLRVESLRRHAHWWETKAKTNQTEVTLFDEYQSLHDFQNDIAAFLIKPLCCSFLFWYHCRRFFYELILMAAHLVTLNPTEAARHFKQCLISLMSILYFFVQFYTEILVQILSLAMRLTLTLGHGIFMLTAGLFNTMLGRTTQPVYTVLAKPSVARPASQGLFASLKTEQQSRYLAAGIRQEVMLRMRWWDYQANTIGKPVTILDEFQSIRDVQNDVAALVIKPVTCWFLSSYHFLRCGYELAFGFIHLLTLNSEESFHHFEQAITSFVGIFYYAIQSLTELLGQALSLAMRTTITIGHGAVTAAQEANTYMPKMNI